MRRLLLVLLLTLLPLQFSWAAVVVYCGHEAGPSADHVGHHEHASHEHGGKPADPGEQANPDAPSAATSSLDCGHCFGSCVGMFAVPSILVLSGLGSASPSLGTPPCAEHLPAQPERPQWGPLA